MGDCYEGVSVYDVCVNCQHYNETEAFHECWAHPDIAVEITDDDNIHECDDYEEIEVD